MLYFKIFKCFWNLLNKICFFSLVLIFKLFIEILRKIFILKIHTFYFLRKAFIKRLNLRFRKELFLFYIRIHFCFQVLWISNLINNELKKALIIFKIKIFIRKNLPRSYYKYMPLILVFKICKNAFIMWIWGWARAI